MPIRNSADILVSELKLLPERARFDNHTGNCDDSGSDSANSLEEEWKGAVDQRYGSAAASADTIQTETDSKKGSQKRRTSKGSDADASGTAEKEAAPGAVSEPHQVLGLQGDDQEPEDMFIDPSNNRVIAVYPGGRRIALGSFIDAYGFLLLFYYLGFGFYIVLLESYCQKQYVMFWQLAFLLVM